MINHPKRPRAFKMGRLSAPCAAIFVSASALSCSSLIQDFCSDA